MDLSQNIKGTYGTIYYVTDMAKAVKYYKEVLGLTTNEESPEWTAFPVAGGHKICLHITNDPSQANGRGILVTSVTNVEGVAAELKKRGAEVVKDVHEVCPNGFAFDIRDANGIELSFFEYKA